MRVENRLSETRFAALYLSVLSVFSVAGFFSSTVFVDFVGFVAIPPARKKKPASCGLKGTTSDVDQAPGEARRPVANNSR